MIRGGGMLFLGILVVFTIVLSAAPVYAQGGLGTTLSTNCLTASPGQTVTIQVRVTGGSSTGPQPVTLAPVGSVPKDSNFTVSPLAGSLPLSANITIHVANESATMGTFQLGVVARSAGEYHITLFTLHVEQVQFGLSTCSSIGLSLPESTFLVTVTSVGLSLLTQVVTRTVVDLDKERKMKAEVAAFNREKKEATLAKDKAKLDKLQKRDLQVKQAQAKLSTGRLKVTLITIVPLFGVYYLMANFLGGYGAIVAVSPILIPYIVGPNGEMVLIWWYFLNSFAFSTLLSHLLHTTT